MTLDEYFEAQDESRRLFERLRGVIESVGAAEMRMTKSQVAFYRRKPFAWAWIPGKYLRGRVAPLVLTLSFPRRDPSPRWKEVVEPAVDASPTIWNCGPPGTSMMKSASGCRRRG